MKCRLLREESTLPCKEYPGEWRCRKCGASGSSGSKITHCPECKSLVGQRSARVPAGTIWTLDVVSLVRQGIAVPADEECERAVGMTPEQLTKAQHLQDRLRLGITPEDFKVFDDGVMRGYKPNGDWIPGPNYEEAAWQQRKQDSPLIIVEDE